MSGETTITICGNLTDAPELRFTPGGAAVATFTVASTPRVWEQRKRAAADPTPTSVRVHESNADFAAHMLTALRDSAVSIDRRTKAGL